MHDEPTGVYPRITVFILSFYYILTSELFLISILKKVTDEERTGKCLRPLKYIRGHLWHRYSIAVNQVVVLRPKHFRSDDQYPPAHGVAQFSSFRRLWSLILYTVRGRQLPKIWRHSEISILYNVVSLRYLCLEDKYSHLVSYEIESLLANCVQPKPHKHILMLSLWK
jgi:hypothetical protein